MNWEALLDHLTNHGALTDEWRAVFADVPREGFTPDRIHVDGGWIDRQEDPERWTELVNSDVVLVTQLDDGQDDEDGTPTSSLSQPYCVAAMLKHLDVTDGMKVLEIGSGWSSGLLAKRLSGKNVTTIEIDPAIGTAVRKHLARAGLNPHLIAGDGTLGCLDRSPWDRVHSTAAVQRIPRAWIEQTRPGGAILTPFGTPYCNGALLKLTVAEDGKSAEGQFVDNMSFMWVRSQRPASRSFDMEKVRHSASPVNPSEIQGSHASAFTVGLRVPGARSREVWADQDQWGTGRSELWDGTSYAHCRYADWDAPHAVAQSGPRRLWDEVVAAYQWWQEKGRPEITRLGLTVTTDGEHRAWLDDAANSCAL